LISRDIFVNFAAPERAACVEQSIDIQERSRVYPPFSRQIVAQTGQRTT
jgi:hypothetical protein